MFQTPVVTKEQCPLCGNYYLPAAMIVDITEGEPILICPNCYSNYMTNCATCTKSQSCAFETDPSPIPKLIQRQYRRGPMTSVVQEKNPERIAITCKKGCECYGEEKGCLREFTRWCDKYDFILRPR